MTRNTKIFYLQKITASQKKDIFEQIKNGAVAVIPTDTVYGLTAAAYAPDAMAKINRLKQNPQDKPMQVLCTLSQAQDLSIPSEVFIKLAQNFWPGNLTLVAKASKAAVLLQGGLNTVGLRVPAFAFALQLMEDICSPLFATSANLHSLPVASTEAQVLAAFNGLADIIVLNGSIETKASAVVDITGPKPLIIRGGEISEKILNKFL